MNSELWKDPLQEIWQRQPVPAPWFDEERLLHEVREAEKAWNREWRDGELAVYVTAAMVIAPKLIPGWTRAEVLRGEWLLTLTLGVFAVIFAAFSWRRWRSERDFAPSLLGRIERGRALLQLKAKMLVLNFIFMPPIAVAIGMLLFEVTGGMAILAIAGGALALGLLLWWAVVNQRKYGAQTAERLARLAAMQAQLQGAAAARDS